MNQFAHYIGMPWEEGATGPGSWDCMAFAAHLQRVHFGVEMPSVTIPDYDDKRALVLLNATHLERENWRQVDRPRHGDMVCIRSPLHYGTWIDYQGGGVLHCVRGVGVVFTASSAWAISGFGRRQYLRHNSKP